MKLSDLLGEKERTLSFEVFPPKTSDRMETVLEATEKIAALQPDFMSVTYGAGGGTSRFTVDIAARLQEEYGTTVLPHLTCVSSSREHVRKMIKVYEEKGLHNIMALRGDIPEGGAPYHDYTHATQLIRDIRELAPDVCVGAACYPEGHVEAKNRDEDLKYLKEKVDAGVDFLTTQLFYDNTVFYHFLYRAREIGIRVPIIAGIMPITNASQVKRTVQMSGTIVPERFLAMVDRFGGNPDAMKQAGVIYATEQIIDLYAHGIRNIHVYSMNKPEVAAGIQASLSAIV